eukprot:scaffold7597_cov132-Isochrysis_galbana.AAC.2
MDGLSCVLVACTTAWPLRGQVVSAAYTKGGAAKAGHHKWHPMSALAASFVRTQAARRLCAAWGARARGRAALCSALQSRSTTTSFS